MGEKDFLVINGLYKSYGEGESKQEVLKDLNVSVNKGEFCVLLGPSGSGKSTLLNIIGGIDGADDGYVSINGDKLKDMDDKALNGSCYGRSVYLFLPEWKHGADIRHRHAALFIHKR